jgi:hypothetical protein
MIFIMNYSFLEEPVKVNKPARDNMYVEHEKICTSKEGRFYSKTNDGNKTIRCMICGKYLRKDGLIYLIQNLILPFKCAC